MQGRNGAISVIALAERGALFDPGPCMYMDKLAGTTLALLCLLTYRHPKCDCSNTSGALRSLAMEPGKLSAVLQALMPSWRTDHFLGGAARYYCVTCVSCS